MSTIVISGSGLFIPPNSISNDELVSAFNAFVTEYNSRFAKEIAAGEVEELKPSSSEFILKASGIKQRYVLDKDGILDTELMRPALRERSNEELSIQAEMAVSAAREALANAGRSPEEVDAVIVACSNLQRAYPAMAIEVQSALGVRGYAFDLNVACSSATFGIQTAADAIHRGSARCVLVINPEICSAHLNFKDRDSHFIFGDACTALVVESESYSRSNQKFAILGTKLLTSFSNNIRNNAGFLNRTHPDRSVRPDGKTDRLFVQEGRKVFKEVVPMVVKLITEHLEESGLKPSDIRRFWLHQANLSMNQLIASKLLGREAREDETPVTLEEFANTSSAGSVIAFHKFSADMKPGELGTLCSFGAGYSAGNVILKRI